MSAYLVVTDGNNVELGRTSLLETVLWRMYVTDDGGIGMTNKTVIKLRLAISGTPKNAWIETDSTKFGRGHVVAKFPGRMERDGALHFLAGALTLGFVPVT